MGFRLAGDVLGMAATLKVSDRARVVLFAMAWHAKDSTGRYWKGHAVLALALGFTEPDSPAATRAVSRAVRDLLITGAITVEREATTHGQTRVYLFPHAGNHPVD